MQTICTVKQKTRRLHQLIYILGRTRPSILDAEINIEKKKLLLTSWYQAILYGFGFDRTVHSK